MLGGGLLLTVAFAAAGSLLARFYGEPLVARIAAAMSLTVLLKQRLGSASGAAQARHAVSRRGQERYRRQGSFGGCLDCVGVPGLGLLGAGGRGLRAAAEHLRWRMVSVPLDPAASALARLALAPMLKFAMYTYGRFSMNYFAHNSDNLLVGWRFGAVALGFYKKAYDLFSLSGSQLTSSTSVVAVAALSRVQRGSRPVHPQPDGRDGGDGVAGDGRFPAILP